MGKPTWANLKYPEEKKETSISKVAASEMERAQTVVRAPRGCGLHKVLESIAEQFWEIWSERVKIP